MLAETAASLGAKQWLKDNLLDQICVGVSINTEHLRPVKEGKIRAVAIPLKTGKKLQNWQVSLYNQNKLTSISTVILANIDIP